MYNVKDYMAQHPGGGELIQNLLGKTIDEEFEEAEHTKSALRVFKDLTVVGNLINEQQHSNDKDQAEQPKKSF